MDLAHTKVTDAGLQHLSGLADLRLLDLSGTAVTYGGLACLNALRRLQVVVVSDASTDTAWPKGGKLVTRNFRVVREGGEQYTVSFND